MIYRTLLLLTILGLSVVNPAYSKSEDSKDWLIRARALAIQTNADGTSNEMGGSVKTGDDLIPEIDITYYLADMLNQQDEKNNFNIYSDILCHFYSSSRK